LLAQMSLGPRSRPMALGDQEFVNEPAGDVKITFATEGDGPAVRVVLREPDTGSKRGERIDPATADEIEAHFVRHRATAPNRFRDQAPLPGGREVLRRMIEELRRDPPSEAGMSRQLDAEVRRSVSQFHATLDASGAVQLIYFKGGGARRL
jgi:hypothetical protein